MLKKLTSLLLTLPLAISLFSCGKEGSGGMFGTSSSDGVFLRDEEEMLAEMESLRGNPIPANADFNACGDNLTWRVDDDVLYIDGEGEMWDFFVKDNPDSEYYTNHCPWLTYGGSVRNIVIGENVTSVSETAFMNMSKVESIYIPESITSIEDRAFRMCRSLKSIKVSENNKYYRDIDGVLFSKDAKTVVCYPMGRTADEYSIPEGVVTIESDAFFCSPMKDIILPESVTTIKGGSFTGCPELESIRIGKNITKIYSAAFIECQALKRVDVDKDNRHYTSVDGILYTKDEKGLFLLPAAYGKTEYSVPDKVTQIGAFAFAGNNVLENVTFADNISFIGEGAFELCPGIEEIVLPKKLEKISLGTFNGCDNLKRVMIPENVRKIEANAFGACNDLTDIYYAGSKEQWQSIEIPPATLEFLEKANIHYNSK